MRRSIIPLLLFGYLNMPDKSYAGSVSGATTHDSSAGFSGCDSRSRNWSCTKENRKKILDSCYVVIHNDKRPNCTWQSCGYISVVGEKPKFTPDSNSTDWGRVEEYGVTTRGEKGNDWKCTSDGKCLPKFPFDRHYLTVNEAFELRKSNDGSDAALRLKEIPDEVVAANHYLQCALSEESTAVVKFVGDGARKGAAGVVVPKSKAAEACGVLNRSLKKETSAVCELTEVVNESAFKVKNNKTSHQCGDINLDGTTDNTDLAELKKQAHEKSYTFESKSLVDFNLDGKLDQIDVRMLASALEKSGTRLSCPARPPVCGDITNNGNVSSLDASRLAQITKGLMENTLEFYGMGDLDLDGEITERDAKILQEYVVGLRKELFCPARSPQ